MYNENHSEELRQKETFDRRAVCDLEYKSAIVAHRLPTSLQIHCCNAKRSTNRTTIHSHEIFHLYFVIF
jgi:hypothetical protein